MPRLCDADTSNGARRNLVLLLLAFALALAILALAILALSHPCHLVARRRKACLMSLLANDYHQLRVVAFAANILESICKLIHFECQHGFELAIRDAVPIIQHRAGQPTVVVVTAAPQQRLGHFCQIDNLFLSLTLALLVRTVDIRALGPDFREVRCKVIAPGGHNTCHANASGAVCHICAKHNGVGI